MATYIKGADTYLPEITPFTPDFKFLSAVLDTRTDKYDANFQATNDLYNKVVYADLSRQDTKDRRDQYAETIAPQIQQISGLDLSLQQNVDQAKSVFAPFYDDDLTVKDIVYTILTPFRLWLLSKDIDKIVYFIDKNIEKNNGSNICLKADFNDELFRNFVNNEYKEDKTFKSLEYFSKIHSDWYTYMVNKINGLTNEVTINVI